MFHVLPCEFRNEQRPAHGIVVPELVELDLVDRVRTVVRLSQIELIAVRLMVMNELRVRRGLSFQLAVDGLSPEPVLFCTDFVISVRVDFVENDFQQALVDHPLPLEAVARTCTLSWTSRWGTSQQTISGIP